LLRRDPYVADYVAAPGRQRATLRRLDHRPWPLPAGRPLMGQTWRDLLFAHWPVAPDELRRLVPERLTLDVFEGAAWLGITPFVVTGLRRTGTPPPPLVATFPELNVRTYVTYGDKPGIFFLSLDAASRLAVLAARRFYRLPYFRARIRSERRGETVAYESRRTDERGHDARFRGRFGPVGQESPPVLGSLEHRLAERYCLYTTGGRGESLRAEIHHPPWPLQPAEAAIELNSMAPPGLALPDEQPLLHFASRQDVLIWPLEPAE
jgi:uncharacterized protein YqjF (DUF2071 family)